MKLTVTVDVPLPMPLWRRALATRETRKRSPGRDAQVEGGRRGGAGNRRHPKAQVGDRFVDVTVTALLEPDGTRNETVRVRCDHCGLEWPAYVFNLRRRRVGKVRHFHVGVRRP